MMKHALFFLLATIAAATSLINPALAQDAAIGHATAWQKWYIDPVTPVNEQLESLSRLVHYIITVIVIFVLGLLGYVILRYNRRANPVPARFSHNTLIEFIWTVVPVIILIVIAVYSLRVHYFVDKHIDADMTVKVTGHQWYWSYQYPDQANIEFDSRIKAAPKDPAHPTADELQPGELRLLEVDNRLVVPVDTNIRVLTTSTDVIHSWAVPAFGIKRDAVPGRLNETWFKATRTGVFYGQCSELCGKDHGFMPIAVEVVTKEQFNAWVKAKQQSAQRETPQKLAALP